MIKSIIKKSKSAQDNTEMPISEHLNELRNRLLTTLFIFTFFTIINFILLKKLTIILQMPAHGVKFLQLAPGEYFFVSVKIALYTSFIMSSPFALYHLVMFILPGLTQKEAEIIIPALVGSIVLFFLGILFGYKILAPAALNFFISYGSDIIEPLWSFEQYFDFLLLLLFSTGLAFQIPIVQVSLGVMNIISSKQMLSIWKYILVLATILGAILTPSTDPFTQIIMSTAILGLYFTGTSILIILKK